MNIRHLNTPARNRSTIDDSLKHRKEIIDRIHNKIMDEGDKEVLKSVKVFTAIAIGICLAIMIITYATK